MVPQFNLRFRDNQYFCLSQCDRLIVSMVGFSDQVVFVVSDVDILQMAIFEIQPLVVVFIAIGFRTEPLHVVVRANSCWRIFHMTRYLATLFHQVMVVMRHEDMRQHNDVGKQNKYDTCSFSHAEFLNFTKHKGRNFLNQYQMFYKLKSWIVAKH